MLDQKSCRNKVQGSTKEKGEEKPMIKGKVIQPPVLLGNCASDGASMVQKLKRINNYFNFLAEHLYIL